MDGFATLVCLVGENPLAVYLGIVQFALPAATIVLVHSAQTAAVAANLSSQIAADSRERGVQWAVDMQLCADPYSPGAVQEVMTALARAHPSGVLNYTGGTKVMSAYALNTWLHANLRAFYLEETAGRDGTFRVDLAEVERSFRFEIGVEDLCRLHGVTAVTEHQTVPATTEDLQKIARAWMKRRQENQEWFLPAESRAIEDAFVRDNATGPASAAVHTGPVPDCETGKNTIGDQWQAIRDLLQTATQAQWPQAPVPCSRSRYRRDLKRYAEFAATKWLEDLAAHLVARVIAPSRDWDRPEDAGVARSREFNVGGQKFESDGMVVRKNRLYYLSATTESREGLCKSKMFEAVYRARQIGGGLARSCLVSMGDQEVVAHCWASLGNDPLHRIYGIDDLRDWLDDKLDSLREFLDVETSQ